MVVQPTGTVALLFTDIEGSIRLLQELGTDRYAETLVLHRRLLRQAFDAHSGYEGDAFFVAFPRAEDAVVAAAAAQQALAVAEWPDEVVMRVRMGLHTGEPLAVPPKYVGIDVHRAARIMAAGHGGQVLVSAATVGLLDQTAVVVRDLGEHRLKDLSGPQWLYQLGEGEFPALKTLYRTNLPVPATALGDTQRARLLAREGLLAAVDIGMHDGFLYGLLGLAATLVDIDPMLAARLIGGLDAATEQLNTTLDSFEARMYENAVATLRVSLGEPAWTAAHHEGQALPLDDVVAEALALSS